MSEPDLFDKEAEELYWTVINDHRDFVDSIMKEPMREWFVPVIAARLRADGEEITLYKQLWEDTKEAYALSVNEENELNARIAKLEVALTKIVNAESANDAMVLIARAALEGK